MNIANCRLMGLASRPQLPPLDVKSVIITIIIIIYTVRDQGGRYRDALLYLQRLSQVQISVRSSICFSEKAVATGAPSCYYCTVQMHEVVITLGKICLVRSRRCCIQQMHLAMSLYE